MTDEEHQPNNRKKVTTTKNGTIINDHRAQKTNAVIMVQIQQESEIKEVKQIEKSSLVV